MIKYAAAINRDRKRLPPRLRVLTDILGVASIGIGAALTVYLYKLCLWPQVCGPSVGEGITTWFIFIAVFLSALTISQFFVLGAVGAVLVVKGNLSAKEAARYAVLYRMPRSWLSEGE